MDRVWARPKGYAASRHGLWHLVFEGSTMNTHIQSACGYMTFIAGRFTLKDGDAPEGEKVCVRFRAIAEDCVSQQNT